MIDGYKDSVLGKIPKKWSSVKLGDVLSKSPEYGANASSKEFDSDSLRYIRITDILENGKLTQSNFVGISSKEGESYRLLQDDILIARTGNTVGKSYLYDSKDGNCSFAGYLIRFKINNTISTPKFIIQYLHSELFWNWVKSVVRTGAQPNINSKEYQSLPLSLPPLPEQQKIAEILSTVDDKIEVIDQQIIETQALKKGLMQRLFTKGIGHTEFKDSPLGMIPESWEVLEFGDLISSHCYGPRFSSKDYSESGNVKTIRGTDINKTGDILYQQVPTAKLPNDFVENHKLKDGDLVMITTADCGLTGVYFDQGFPFIPSAYAVRIRLNEKAYPFYFKFMFQTELAKNQVEKYIRKGTVANLPGSDILKFTFPTPPIEEQQKIAEILSSVDDKLNVLLEKKTHYQELKQGLMQQLLTGKIRVKV